MKRATFHVTLAQNSRSKNIFRIYFLVNASPPKPFDVATLNFVGT